MNNAKLFRHFHLKIGKLELGAPLPETVLTATGARPGDTTLQLPSVSFGKAKKITLHLTPDGRLESANFEYNSDADFETMIGDYKSLGAPARESSKRSDVTIDVARWSDESTQLTLTRETDASGTRLRSEMRDRRGA